MALGYAYCAEGQQVAGTNVYLAGEMSESRYLLSLAALTSSIVRAVTQTIGPLVDMLYMEKALEAIELILANLQHKSESLPRMKALARSQDSKRKWVVLLQNTGRCMRPFHPQIFRLLEGIFSSSQGDDFFSHVSYNEAGVSKTFDIMTKKQLGHNFSKALERPAYAEDSASGEGLVRAVDELFQEIRMTRLDTMCEIWLFVFTDTLEADSLQSLQILKKLE